MSRSLCLMLAMGLSLGCQPKKPAPEPAPPKPPAKPTPPPAEPKISKEFTGDAAKLLAKIDNTIAGHQKRAEASPKDWLTRGILASSYMTRSRLTNSYDDWSKADAALKDSFKAAPKGGGAFDIKAKIDFALHRFNDAEAALETFSKRLLLQPRQLATIEAMRAELALQRGQIAEARAGFDRAYAKYPAPETYVQMAQIEFKTGKVSDARALVDKAVEGTKTGDKFLHAWVLLHRGILELDTGHYADAKTYFERANKSFSGWFLIEEHLAEVTSLLGDDETALTMYRGIVARVPAGEFMEALADTYDSVGKKDEADTWRAKAGETYRADMARYPQAVYGHGMDYFLSGDDVEEAVRIATANHELRPGFDAKTRLAQAFIRAGKLQDAKTLVDTSLAAGWRTSDLHATASVLATLQGDEARAKAQRELAIALHKDAMEGLEWLKPKS